jgi:hypothetical protein
MFLSGAMCLAQVPAAPELDPQLKEMLDHDSACESAGKAAADPTAATQSPILDTIHNSRGQKVGIIARVGNPCHCSQGNCRTLVYLKSGQSYRLALKENLASLRQLRGFKQSMPALSGKVQVSDSRAETIIYEWDSGNYHAGICATVVQTKGHPAITKHPCGTVAGSIEKP